MVHQSAFGRRAMLLGGVSSFIDCVSHGEVRPSGPSAQPSAPASPGTSPIVAPHVNRSNLPVTCRITEPNIQGPYYLAGAEQRSDLVDAGMVGQALLLTGSVRSADCQTPLAGASIEVWQADGEGRYDIDGTFPKGTPHRLRGKQTLDSAGGFAFRSVVPGRYLNGGRYRPAHVHVKVTAEGHRTLISQLYFPEDPQNEGDPFFLPSLLLQVQHTRQALEGRYDIALAKL